MTHTDREKALNALSKLGDSSCLFDIERNSLETTIRTAILATTWQPIETAPRNMSKILLFIPTVEKTKAVQGRVNSYGTVWRDFEVRADDYGSQTTGDATHWMPLPPPPTAHVNEVNNDTPKE